MVNFEKTKSSLMKIHQFDSPKSLLSLYIAQLRDISIQNDSMRFRTNLERIGMLLGYEISKTLHYTNTSITTPLGEATGNILQHTVVICSVLRAGVPLHNGLLKSFDTAESAYISAYRKHSSPTEFEIKVEYLAAPTLENKTLIIADPMLATGRTFVNVLEALKPLGNPKELHLVAAIGSKEGINHLEKAVAKDTRLWIAAIDPTLNDKGYIVPGLGDAGDLCFGGKLQQ
jgi:uracil phosphoribosyltransferase